VHALVDVTRPRRSPRVLSIGCRTVEATHHHYSSTLRPWYTCHKAHFPIHCVFKLPWCPKPCTCLFSAWLTQTASTRVGAAATRIMNLARLANRRSPSQRAGRLTDCTSANQLEKRVMRAHCCPRTHVVTVRIVQLDLQLPHAVVGTFRMDVGMHKSIMIQFKSSFSLQTLQHHVQ
jgi:hypothetical protein